MEKRVIVAIVLSIVIIVTYQYMAAKLYPVESSQEDSMAYQKKPDIVSQAKTSVISSKQELISKGAEDVIVETELFRLVLTTSGARIKSFRLKNYQTKPLKVIDVEKEIARQKNMSEKARLGLFLEEVRNRDKRIALLEKELRQADSIREQQEIQDRLLLEKEVEIVSLESRYNKDYPLSVLFPGTKELAGVNLAIYKPDKKILLLDQGNKSGSISFIYANDKGLKLTKRFVFSYDSYSFDLELIVDRITAQALRDKPFFIKYGPGITRPEIGEARKTYNGPVVRIQEGSELKINREKYSRQEASQFITRRHPGNISWVALQDKYFIVALIPLEPVQAAVIEKDENERCSVLLKAVSPQKSYSARVYIGPKEKKSLTSLDAGLEEIIDYGFFGPIARLLAVILNIFYRWTHNYGYAIILLALTTKIIFYPLTHKSFEAMKKMQEDMKIVQPQLMELKEKHKNNPQKLNKETMELYKKTGTNPLAGCRGGCLPLLLQMPVFIALYVVLYNSIKLRGAPFLWWITDLSVKDPYYILPILMGISTLVQQKITGLGKTGVDNQQAKMMMWMMPVFLVWIFAKFPSGVVLYWFVFNIFTSIQQLLITKTQPSTT